ncbi:SRPBCC family protein [Herbiconiux sp. L3-i23]|uniref:SRPBCC family protein n=1 Tax=Herbiconiux sp. L3-i23 TaxID=2905871 RepID=UPI002052DA58|nr:SRPBCC family protein [Herbiconiux sp. L3-i23]BDI21954.1 polyketide cyclase [Herbiconiux sp. L3-i23]
MATNTAYIDAAPEAVFVVLGDGWLYPNWVVGASRMRDVDESWPSEGAKLHHSFGTWPVLLDDNTEMLEWDPPRRAVLQARGWPIGEARVVIRVQARGAGCVVRIDEDAAEGPGRLVPKVIRDLGLRLRNRETLHRLAYLVEGGAAKR